MVRVREDLPQPSRRLMARQTGEFQQVRPLGHRLGKRFGGDVQHPGNASEQALHFLLSRRQAEGGKAEIEIGIENRLHHVAGKGEADAQLNFRGAGTRLMGGRRGVRAWITHWSSVSIWATSRRLGG